MTIAPTPVSHGQPPHRLYLSLLSALVLLVAAGVVLLARHDPRDGSTSSNVRGSGVAATQLRELPAFASIDLAGTNSVVVHVGGRQSLVVHADDNLIEHVTTDVRSGKLVIADAGSFSARTPMRVEVSVPTLDAVTLSGDGLITVDTVSARHFRAQLPGSGVLHASGTADTLDAKLGGSGDLQLQDLTARAATVAVSGSGRLQVRATAALDASVSGSGAILYSGDPREVTRSVTGTGAIIKQ
jgi:Putative auto-transporter adhesin, head GIN domain